VLAMASGVARHPMVMYRITVLKEIKKSKMMCLGSATKSRGCGLFFGLQMRRAACSYPNNHAGRMPHPREGGDSRYRLFLPIGALGHRNGSSSKMKPSFMASLVAGSGPRPSAKARSSMRRPWMIPGRP